MAKVMSMDGGAGAPGTDAAAEALLREKQEALPEREPPTGELSEVTPVATDDDAGDAQEPKRPPRRLRILAAVLAVILGAAGFFGYQWWTVGRFIVSTDDAYVGADTAIIAPKISGYVRSVPVADNAYVTAGTPLVILDDSDYRVALSKADAQVSTQEAAIARVGEQIKAADAQVASAQAQLASAKAAATNAESDFNRTKALADKKFATDKAVEAARTAMLQARAGVTAADAALSAARANAGVVAAQKTEAERLLDQYRLARDQAQLNLDHTIIRAPFDGAVGNRAAEPGEFVAAGTRLMALVPLNVFVDANFKETQLADLAPGQAVTVTVDAYPDQPVDGVVESVAPASGSTFSLLPPDNATGNFTKIVQRVPVRIRLRPGALSGQIRPGMSVVAEVDTRTRNTTLASR